MSQTLFRCSRSGREFSFLKDKLISRENHKQQQGSVQNKEPCPACFLLLWQWASCLSQESLFLCLFFCNLPFSHHHWEKWVSVAWTLLSTVVWPSINTTTASSWCSWWRHSSTAWLPLLIHGQWKGTLRGLRGKKMTISKSPLLFLPGLSQYVLKTCSDTVD